MWYPKLPCAQLVILLYKVEPAATHFPGPLLSVLGAVFPSVKFPTSGVPQNAFFSFGSTNLVYQMSSRLGV